MTGCFLPAVARLTGSSGWRACDWTQGGEHAVGASGCGPAGAFWDGGLWRFAFSAVLWSALFCFAAWWGGRRVRLLWASAELVRFRSHLAVGVSLRDFLRMKDGGCLVDHQGWLLFAAPSAFRAESNVAGCVRRRSSLGRIRGVDD